MPEIATLGLSGVSRETIGRLEEFSSLVQTWTRKINLVSGGSVPEIWTRHILDSVQAFDVASPKGGAWVDLGSGAGFPGAVVAILAQDRRPDLKVTCVESDKRKAAFLRTVSRETGTHFKVVTERVEALTPMHADILSARALAHLEKLLGYASIHLAPQGVAVFHKGERHHDEIAAAREKWRFKCDIVESSIAPQSAILKIGGISRV